MAKVTKDQIEAWKKKFGEIFAIKVDDKTAYLKKPDRNTLRLAFSKAATDPLGMNEVILNNCWLGGDTEIKTDDSYFIAAMPQMQSLIEERNATLEKL